MDLEERVAKLNTENPRGMNNGFLIATSHEFPFLHFLLILKDDAIQGISIGGGLSFIILILSTKNIYVSVLAILSVLSVVTTLIGSIHWCGW